VTVPDEPTIPNLRLTRRERRLAQERETRRRVSVAWILYTLAVTVVIVGAAWLAVR
jgi:hypothetical protein